MDDGHLFQLLLVRHFASSPQADSEVGLPPRCLEGPLEALPRKSRRDMGGVETQSTASRTMRGAKFTRKLTSGSLGDNLNLDSTHQVGQVTIKGRNTGERRELQANGGQQGLETPPHKPGP